MDLDSSSTLVPSKWTTIKPSCSAVSFLAVFSCFFSLTALGFARFCLSSAILKKHQFLGCWKIYMMRGLSLSLLTLLLQAVVSTAGSHQSAPLRPRASTTALLEDFQVYKPVPYPPPSSNPRDCVTKKVLMDYVFGNSYGQPFVGDYTPPACNFNSVVMEIVVTSAGVQFDRLAMMYLGSIEVWRTSTAEPTATGIIWEYTKDMSQYLSLWKKPQTIIFDLDNVVNSEYTGTFNTTLTATFFNKADAPTKADLILPISAELGSAGEASVFSIPSQNATVQQTIPANAERAMVSVSACGQINEEFWYTNLFTSEVNTFENTAGTFLGYGPFREIQLLIDGTLAGVIWPFPIIFTGGIAPGLWRPIVGIDAFDLREGEIDITPFLPMLTDGLPHSFQINVVGLVDNNGHGPATLTATAPSYWLVTGKIFVFLGKSKTTKHTPPTIYAPAPEIYLTSSYTESNGTNETLTYTTTAKRTYLASSSYGTWSQSLSYSNEGFVSAVGFTQINTQSTKGTDTSLDKSDLAYSNVVSFSYPITVNETFAVFSDGAVFIDADVSRGLIIDATGRPDISVYTLVAGPSSLDATQFGTAEFQNQVNASFSFGDTTEDFKETSYGTTYIRDVHAVNTTVVSDTIAGSHSGGGNPRNFIGPSAVGPFRGTRGFIGKGPGTMAQGTP